MLAEKYVKLICSQLISVDARLWHEYSRGENAVIYSRIHSYELCQMNFSLALTYKY